MKIFSGPEEMQVQTVMNDHGGIGPIAFRRLFSEQDFASPVDFIDLTFIPPMSKIGLHFHHGNEEAYIIFQGNPLVTFNGQQRRLAPGCVAVVHDGQSHELVNDTHQDVGIFVIQVRIVRKANEVPTAQT